MKLETYDLFNEVSRKSMHIMREKLKSCGLYKGQPKLLFLLNKDDGLTKKEISQRFEIAAPTVTKMVERLENNNFLYTKKDENDKRITRVYISDKGKLIIEEVMGSRIHAADIYFKDLSEEEVEAFNVILKKIRNNISEHKEGCCE